jgi:hypothetical protein
VHKAPPSFRGGGCPVRLALFDDVVQVAALLPRYRIVVQLIHADAEQRFDVFSLMFAASLEQARIAHKCFKAAQVLNHWMFW